MHEDEKNPRSTTEGAISVKGKFKKQYCVFEKPVDHATSFC